MDTDLGKEKEGATMTIGMPNSHERGSVAATTTTRNSIHSKMITANSSAKIASKLTKHVIALEKQNYIEQNAEKYLIDVSLDAYEILKCCILLTRLGSLESAWAKWETISCTKSTWT